MFARRSAALDEFLTTSFWVGQDGRGARILHPLLRRLLLLCLETAAADAQHKWDEVHTRLKNFYADKGATDYALYHSLALEELPAVVQALIDIPLGFDVEKWYERLLFITNAPRRLGDNLDASSVASKLVSMLITEWNVDASTADSDSIEVVARLITAMWIENDPLVDPDDALVDVVKSQLAELASRRWKGSRDHHYTHEYFLKKARNYHRSLIIPWTYTL
jgi:hypothetical protein